MNKVEIACEGVSTLDIKDMLPIQKDLKELTEENYQKLKKQIIDKGFSAPFFIWKNKILDGTQRHRVLTKMREEGWKVPKLPIVNVHAKNEKEARSKLLAFTSQFGKMTGEGLYEFMNESDIDFSELSKEFNFAEIDFKKFDENYFKESNDESDETLSDVVQFIVSIHCRDENQMQSLYEEFKERGLECKLIT